MWLACHTQEEIADELGEGKTTVHDRIQGLCSDLSNYTKPNKLAALYEQADWEPPLYDIWTQAKMKDGPLTMSQIESDIR